MSFNYESKKHKNYQVAQTQAGNLRSASFENGGTNGSREQGG